MQNNNKETHPMNILDYWGIVKNWKKFIILNIIIVTIAATIIAFLLPKWYYSYAIIRPNEESGGSLFSAVLGAKGLSSIGKNLNIGGLQYSNLDYYQSLILSRKITISVIKKYDLQKTYDQKYLFKTIKELKSNTVVQIRPRPNLFILGVYDKKPTRAKDMVQTYLNLLDSTIIGIDKVGLKFNRTFLEERYKKNIFDLETAQSKLKIFQEKEGVIIPEEQFKGTMKAYAEIEARKLLLQSQLISIKFSQNENSPLVKSLDNQIKALDFKINEFKSKNSNDSDVKFFVSLGKAPELIKGYITLYREVEIQSKLLEFIYPLYQQAQMDENRKGPSFIIIDKPFLPEYKDKPQRAVIIVSGFVFSFIFSLFFVFLAEYINKLKRKRI